MRIVALGGAQQDLDEALAHYAVIRQELVDGLFQEVVAAKRLIVQLPQAWHSLGNGLRSFSLHRYPYSIIYRPSRDEIIIVAFAHHRRRPGYWRER